MEFAFQIKLTKPTLYLRKDVSKTPNEAACNIQ